MKTIKGAAFFFFSFLLGSCFSPPEYSSVPSISFDEVYFRDASTGADTLVVIINFQDGDGDLGLDATQNLFPFHSNNFYIALDGGPPDSLAVAPRTLDPGFPPILDIPDGIQGKIATSHTHEQPGFGAVFPVYDCPYTRKYYRIDSIFVLEKDKHLFDETYSLKHTYHSSMLDQDVFMLYDTFYYQQNPFQFNIQVDFLVQGNNGFEMFDWKEELCQGANYDGRFPVLGGGSALEGSLRYDIIGSGFVPLFAGKIMRLRVKIRDRALNTSNTITTDQFTLEKIRRSAESKSSLQAGAISK